MSLYSEITKEVDALPEGPQVGAFFDFDGTVIGGYSAFAFFKTSLKSGKVRPKGWIKTISTSVKFARGKADFATMLRQLTQGLVGISEVEYLAFGEKVYRELIAEMIYPETRALIEAHQKKGHTVAICSSATPYQVLSAAKDLKIDTVLTTRLEVVNGFFTGEVVLPTLWGKGKANAVEDLCAERGIRLEDSFFYADGSEDVALMRRIGHPRPTNPHDRLRKEAIAKGWPVRDFSNRNSKK